MLAMHKDKRKNDLLFRVLKETDPYIPHGQEQRGKKQLTEIIKHEKKALIVAPLKEQRDEGELGLDSIKEESSLRSSRMSESRQRVASKPKEITSRVVDVNLVSGSRLAGLERERGGGLSQLGSRQLQIKQVLRNVMRIKQTVFSKFNIAETRQKVQPSIPSTLVTASEFKLSQSSSTLQYNQAFSQLAVSSVLLQSRVYRHEAGSNSTPSKPSTMLSSSRQIPFTPDRQSLSKCCNCSAQNVQSVAKVMRSVSCNTIRSMKNHKISPKKSRKHKTGNQTCETQQKISRSGSEKLIQQADRLNMQIFQARISSKLRGSDRSHTIGALTK